MPLEPHPIWPFPPNWGDSVNETREWRTDVMVSPTGAEQRRALRPYPRRFLSYDVALMGRERAYADNLLHAYSGGTWWIPQWHDVCVTSAATSFFGNVIQIPNASENEWEAVVIWASPFDCRVYEVGSVLANSIQIVGAIIGASYPAGTMVMPAVTGRLTDEPRFSKMSDTVWTGETRFLLFDNDQQGYPNALASSYRSYPVMTAQPDESERLNANFERMMLEVDNGIGHPVYRDTAERRFDLYRYNWVISGRQQTRDFETLLNQLCGRLRPIWMPTFNQDFEVLSATPTTLTVVDNGLLSTGGLRPGREDLLIRTVDGVFARQIVSASSPGPTLTLTLGSALPATYSADQFVAVSFMDLMRLNSDTLQLEHLTDTQGVLTCEAIFRSAPNIRTAASAFA